MRDRNLARKCCQNRQQKTVKLHSFGIDEILSPSISEEDRVIHRLKSNKITASYGVPAELLKATGSTFNNVFHRSNCYATMDEFPVIQKFSADDVIPEEEYEKLYTASTEILVLLSIVYGSISVIAVIGNSLVIWIVATTRHMHTVTNMYIANLALAD
uniref:G-protein coupled receptors family 1 profile domain-containing protein n=1 Tax=Megaselia scalaris TaxID=36166 RepID=T1GW44_MEGSC